MNPKPARYLCAFLITLFGFIGISYAQDFHLRNYSTEDGLSNRFIYTINQDESGYLWIGTGSGLSRFDGFEFQTDFLPDSLSESFFNCSMKDSLGSLWFGSNNGLVIQYDGHSFTNYNLNEYTTGAITGLIEGLDRTIIVSTQSGGLIKIDPINPHNIIYHKLEVGLIFSIGKDPNGRLLVGTNDGLMLYSFPKGNQKPQLISKIDQIPSTRINVLYYGSFSGDLFVGTEDKGLYLLKTGTHADRFNVFNFTRDIDLKRPNIRSIIETKRGELWVSTFRSGVIKLYLDDNQEKVLDYQLFNTKNGLINNTTQVVFQDFENNIWIGTAGNGLSILMDEAFTFLNTDKDMPGNSISSIVSDEFNYYFAGENGIGVFDNKSMQIVKSFGKNNGLPADQLTSLVLDGENLWVGTRKSGLYLLSLISGRANPFFVSNDDNEKSINHIICEDENLWIATNNGIFLFDLALGSRKHFSTRDGLPHNNISHLYLDQDKNIWFSTLSDVLYYLSGTSVVKSKFPSAGIRIDFQQITMADNGDVWAATYGNGVLHFTSDTVYNVTMETGLLSNYCYSIFADNQNRIWVGHRQGYSRICDEEKIINTYGPECGILGDANPNSGMIEKDARVLLGTSQGVLIYDFRMDKETSQPPKVSVNSIYFNEEEIPFSKKIVMPYASYELKIDFVGISYSNPEKVVYQYKLENYDSDWSAYTPASEVIYNRLDDGEYKFLLYAFNADFETSEEAFSFVILVRKPIWKTWWFYALLSILLVSTVVVIIILRERKQKKFQAFLEKKLDERTREVVEQKDEIELKNKEITDSINYAQRIQASILPPVQKLTDSFPGSFVFYQPRDIVSGDFYWWDRVDDERFIIVCADSTGHGVPGAFMSMIGSTLIKDIVARDANIKPSSLLSILDREITASLNQNLEVHASNDGMDIIVCEFNTKTNHLRFSSAMRPIILFHKGEQYYIRGNRSSIGGDTLTGKVFEDQEYQLDKGDVVYLFSDGYPDQFGGPIGKKLKMVRLKNLLEDIHDKNMDEQYKHVKQNFEIWKGNLDQVDDVLFMGIQV